MSYKKRGQAGWTGKKEAKRKVRRERNFSKEEIREIEKEMFQGEEYRVRSNSKKELTPKQKIERQLIREKSKLDYWERPNILGRHNNDGWISGIISRYRDSIKKLEKKLEEFE